MANATRTLTRLIAGLGAVLLLAAGCGDSAEEDTTPGTETQEETPPDDGDEETPPDDGDSEAVEDGEPEELSVGGCDVWGENVSMTIGGGASGGAYFVIGAELAEIINDELECVTASSASGTSAEFMRAELDIVLTIGDNAFAVWSGDGTSGFEEGEMYDYGFMASGHNSEFLHIVNADSDIATFSDLGAGDTMGVGAPTLVHFNRTLLDMYGAEEAEIDILQGYDQLLTALRQGQFEVVEIGTAHPTTALIEAQESQELRALPHDGAILEEFIDGQPFIGTGLVEAGTYNFLEEDHPNFGRRMTIIAHNSVQEELIHAVTQALFDNVDRLAAVLQQGDQYTLDVTREAMELGTIRIPLHPGARDYYEDQGLTIPESVPEVGTTPPGDGG